MIYSEDVFRIPQVLKATIQLLTFSSSAASCVLENLLSYIQRQLLVFWSSKSVHFQAA